MRLLAVVVAVLIRFACWLLLLLWWVVRLAQRLILWGEDSPFYLPRLLIGGVLRPLGNRYVLIAVAIAIIIAASNPRLQNPSFYPLFAGGLLACFLSGKFGRALLPKTTPSLSGLFPPLPGMPGWPPIPKARRRVAGARQGAPSPTVPVRPSPSGVRVMASQTMAPSPSEAEAVSALPEALQRLMRPRKELPSGGPAGQEANG